MNRISVTRRNGDASEGDFRCRFRWSCCRSSCWSVSRSSCCCGWRGARRNALVGARPRSKDIALRQPNWPERPTQIANCFANQFEIPLLFYVLIAIALPLRHTDLVIVLLSWVFVVTRFAHAGIFVTSNDVRTRSLAWFAGVLVLFAMWLYFALKILLV